MFQTQINRLLLAVVALNLCFLVGCHRSYYRRQANAEAGRLVREKAVDPRWNSTDGSIEIDPQSRMFNPFSQDHPPIPPDDQTSHQLMHEVDGKAGYPNWHANGDTDAIENPDWKAYLPVNENGEVVLTLDRAYQLALLHSPVLQQQYETLYLSALDVSLERFGFDSQLFSGFSSFLTTQGRFRGSRTVYAPSPPAPPLTETRVSGSQTAFSAANTGLRLQRLGVTGTEFVVGLANSILFNSKGIDSSSASSLFNFSLVQPLLRGAGRERIMESLTQSERTLLANIRQLERFKRGFYLQVAVGRNAGAGPGGNFLSTPGGGGTNAGGFFGLLEQNQQIRNQEFNVRQLEGVLAQFKEFFLRERLDAVQLKLFETGVYREQRNLLDAKTRYQTSLDNFKLSLGLPPDLNVVLDDSLLDRFELITDEINDRLISIGDLREETGNELNRISDLFRGFGDADFQWPENLNQEIQKLLPYIQRGDDILEKLTTTGVQQLERDFEVLDQTRPRRLEYLELLKREIASGRLISEIDPGLFAPDSIPTADSLRQVLVNPETDNLEFIEVDGRQEPAPRSIMRRAEDLKLSFADARQRIINFEQTQQEKTPEEVFNFLREEFQQEIPGLLSELNNLTLEITLLQASARSNSIEIPEVSIDDEQAIRIARCFRRDWMNARAALVDSWRSIEFVADQLEAQVDLIFEGDMGLPAGSNNPFKLRYETGQLRAGFRIDAPIVRMSERNRYAQALVSYQQNRRRFYQFEDAVKAILRDEVRNVGRNKVLFELDRRTVQVQIENLEINRLELEQPVGPNANSSRLGTSTARNLTDAINNLNSAQNSFLRSWVQYEVLRRNLDYDMGTMQVDETGAWIDPGAIDETIGLRAAAMMGIELDCQFCQDIGTSYSPLLTEEEAAKLGESVLDSGESNQESDLKIYLEQRRRQQQVPLQSPETPEQRELELRLEQLRQLQEQRELEDRLNRPQQPALPLQTDPPAAGGDAGAGSPDPEGAAAAPAQRDLAPAVAPIQWPTPIQPAGAARKAPAEPLETGSREPATAAPTTPVQVPATAVAPLPLTQTIQLVALSQTEEPNPGPNAAQRLILSQQAELEAAVRSQPVSAATAEVASPPPAAGIKQN